MNIIALVIIGIIVMLLLAFGIVMFVVLYQRRVINHQIEIEQLNQQKQNELINASIQSEERERKRIAAELHDDIGATLSSIRLFLYKAAKVFSDKDDIIGQSKILLDESIHKIRNISHQLQPGTLEYLGLQGSLKSLVGLLSRTGNLNISFVSEGEWEKIEDSTALAVYRIIQELINNILKHANASVITIECRQALNGKPCVLLFHNGTGLTNEDYQTLLYKENANGLKNIEYRIKSADIDIQFEKMAVTSYKITILFPTSAMKNY